MKPHSNRESSFADHIGCDVKVVNRLVNGRTSITAEMAIRLGAALRVSLEFWLNVQQAVKMKEVPTAPLRGLNQVRRGGRSSIEGDASTLVVAFVALTADRRSRYFARSIT